jgi:hypothetical protein
VHECPRHHAGAGQRGPGVGGSHRSQSLSRRGPFGGGVWEGTAQGDRGLQCYSA